MSQNGPGNTARNILVVGAGPAAWRFVRAYHEGAQDAGRASDTITVLNDEPYIPYDRVAIEQLFKDTDKDLTLGDPALWDESTINLVNNTRGESLNRDSRVVKGSDGVDYPYDVLVFATGSSAVRIPIPNADCAHVFRTADDVKNMVSEVERLQTKLGRARAVLLSAEAFSGWKPQKVSKTLVPNPPSSMLPRGFSPWRSIRAAVTRLTPRSKQPGSTSKPVRSYPLSTKIPQARLFRSP